MSLKGTDSYASLDDLPPLVHEAVELARRSQFEFSCRPEQGRLLQALAAGACSRIGETGTGCGVGLAWLLSGRHNESVEVVTVERDPGRASAVQQLVAHLPNVSVHHGDWSEIQQFGPFDLLVLDGGGHGKWGEPVHPRNIVTPGGSVVIDDFQPADAWPPRFEGSPDSARIYWLQHPDLMATEVRLAPDLATVIAARKFG